MKNNTESLISVAKIFTVARGETISFLELFYTVIEQRDFSLYVM